METELLDDELETDTRYHDLKQSFDNKTPDWHNEALAQFQVIRRNGQLTEFNADKISAAITKAFLAIEHSVTPSGRIKQITQKLTKKVIIGVSRRLKETGKVHIEDIQDQVELALMREEKHQVARAYVLYREQHAMQRAEQNTKTVVNMIDDEGISHPLDEQRLRQVIIEACSGLADVNSEAIIQDSLKNLFDGIGERDLNNVLVMTVRALIEKEPNYTYVASRLLLDRLRSETLTHIKHTEHHLTAQQMGSYYPEYFKKYLEHGVKYELLLPELMDFDITRLGQALKPERDLNFTYLGLQTLYDRYFLHWQDTRFELPQAFFMRVAMGLSIREQDREARAIEFYELLSSFSLMSSTPTLFNSGTLRPQLSSCFISTIPDDLDGIFSAIKDNALMQKWAGGIGNDWTPVRGMGSIIKGTNGRSQGVVPFLKVANDTLVSVNQCLAPNTLIYTDQGTKPIQSVQKGNLVLGQHGQYREVLEQFIYLQKQDAMLKLEVKYSIDPIQVTTGHPFWAIQGVELDTQPQTTLKRLQQNQLQAQWIEARKLQMGDYIAQVIPQEIIPVATLSEQDVRFYGIMLGIGYVQIDENIRDYNIEWGILCHAEHSALNFIYDYLKQRQIAFNTTHLNAKQQIKITWADMIDVPQAERSTTDAIMKQSLAFTYSDLYNEQNEKYIAPRLAHLPLSQTKILLQAIIETSATLHQHEFYLSTISQQLAESLRYQCLRLGIPVAGERIELTHQETKIDVKGRAIELKGTIKAYDLTIPAVAPLIDNPNTCNPITQCNWIRYKNWLFIRVYSIQSIAPVHTVYDLKVEGDESYMTATALMHNGGKRRGSGCAYLEVWHIDIDEFLELRKNTGDERRRTHDMNTAVWISDLFMKRLNDAEQWSLFSPNETPDLHDLYGEAFQTRYEYYETLGKQGKLEIYKQISAVELWRKILTMLFETGHPWITFKDPCNIRSPQQHVGVVHSSNLCTEISLNTKAFSDPIKNINEGEIAVCNLASVNLPAHIENGKLNETRLKTTITTAMRMLDNVVDINYYSVPQAKNANLKHRPVGLGIMGFQDSLYKMRIPYATQEAVEFADEAMEFVSYYAISASSDLAQERGKYPSFDGSLWSQGVLPIDSVQRLKQVRGNDLKLNTGARLDWHTLREKVKTQGMRNSNTMAIAPTACVTGDTLILSSQGLIPIESLAESQAQWQNIEINIAQEGNLALSNKLYLNGVKETKRITTKSGSEITATPNHRIRIIDKKGDYVWKYVADLQIGDEVVRRIGGHQELLADKALIDLVVPQITHFNQKPISLPTQLSQSVAFLLGLYMSDGYLKYSDHGHYAKKEGLSLAIDDNEVALLESLRQDFIQWGITILSDVSKKDSAYTSHLILSSQLVEWFELNQFNKQCADFAENSVNAFIPQKILQSNSHVLCAFLSGLFAANATVTGHHVEMTTVSQTLAKQVKIALESLGILATLSTSKAATEDNHLTYHIRTSNIKSSQYFLKYIGFGASIKQQKLIDCLAEHALSDLSDQQRGHDNIDCDHCETIYPTLHESKLGQLLAMGNLYFEPITNIEPSHDMTYDLQVPENHTYVANGFISHNTISNICGVSQSIEPTYQNLFIKTNLSGSFAVINQYLIHDLKALNLWDDTMVNDLKFYDGSVQDIERIPEHIKELYATAFEIAPEWLVEAASRRQKWIDQSQSLNLYMKETSGRKLDALYKLAWLRGLKTTYYLRTMAATRVQKSTLQSSSASMVTTPMMPTMQACAIDDPDCEACQ